MGHVDRYSEMDCLAGQIILKPGVKCVVSNIQLLVLLKELIFMMKVNNVYSPELYVAGTLYTPIKFNQELGAGKILQRFKYAKFLQTGIVMFLKIRVMLPLYSGAE